MTDSRANVFIQRFSESTRLFRAIHDSNAFNRLRQGRDEVVNGKGAIEMNLYITGLLPLRIKSVHRFLNSTGNGTHGDENVFRIRRAVVFEEFIITARKSPDLLHVFIHDLRQAIIPKIARFFRLEIHIRIGYGAAHNRMFRIKTVMFEIIKRIPVDEFLQFFFRKHLNFLNFMRRTEPVKEMHERYMPFNSRQVRHSGKIRTFLHACATKHGKAGITTAHNVRMISENGHCMRPHRTGGNMKNHRFQLSG